MVVGASAQQELIPGYVATTRLGAGGYGEVWKVDAPGGLQKAVKIIYGFLTEERATRELKSLENIKLVRHPFLLSLERIEVVDGRLMIVTELADMSLVDRFEQCRKANLPGIPREELLGYLHDAADALDYMLQTHSLQHLDVKPENLLLVSGRTKVADFGLVKEIADKTRSLVGAMTPTYAAPEVFEGKASRTCDQYSLAIVYQEMLTGVLPFPGRNAAQLAAQHTRNRPQLSALPAADRDVINRALSKRPQDRFPSCRELVDALRAALRAPATPVDVPPNRSRDDHDTRAKQNDDTRTANLPTSPTPENCTEPLAPPARPQTAERPVTAARPVTASRPVTSSRPVTAARHRSTAREEIPVVQVAASNTDLPPEPIDQTPASLRPAMFIGVGRTGVLALEHLVAQLRQRWGDAAARDGFPTLAVETDGAVLKHSSARHLDSQDIVHVPLRQAHDYRAEADELLGWLGRRWLYNIPKSGETLGMRPWGRLAVLDHAAVIVSKLRPRLAALTNGTAAKALEQVAPGDVRHVPPRVFLIGSCSGGTGGGALLELAYAVRNITKRLGAGELDVSVIFTSSTNQCPTQAQLALANTVAFLTELQHYARCGAEGLAGSTTRSAVFESNDFPLNHAYYLDLGSELSSEAYEEQVARVADYLYCDVATPLGGVLDTYREPQPDAELQTDLKLRSFRMARFNGLGHNVLSSLAMQLAEQAVRAWLSDAGQKDSVATRHLDLNDNAADAAGGQTDYAMRSLASSLAMDWYSQQEALFFPIDKARPALEPQMQALRQMARQALLEQLAHLRQHCPQPEATSDFVAFMARMKEPAHAARWNHYLQVVSQQALQRYVNSLVEATHKRLATLPRLSDLLLDEAHQQARALFCEMTPDAEVVADGAIRASSRPVMAHLEARASAQYPFGCVRRTFLMTPRDWRTSAPPDASYAQVPVAEPHAFVCEELGEISLGQVVDKLLNKHVEIGDVVEHLHARIDIQWSSPARPALPGEVLEADLLDG